MKVVYVSDNRARGNYGCRGTSTALSQLIRRDHEIVGVVSGAYSNWNMGPVFYNPLLPRFVYPALAQSRHWPNLRKGLHFLQKAVHHPFGSFALSSIDLLSTHLDRGIARIEKAIDANDHVADYDLRKYDFDAMIVNGEGSFIFATPAWRESILLLTMMHWAQKLGKKVYFVNAMLSDDPYSPRNQKVVDLAAQVLSRCELVSVREEESLAYAHNVLGLSEVSLFPDALFTWVDLINDEHRVLEGKYYMGHSTECDAYYEAFDFREPYICISGSSSPEISQNPKVAVEKYADLVHAVKKRFGMPVYLVKVCEGDEFLEAVGQRTATPVVALDTPIVAAGKILAGAAVYISGRYHPSILASLGGTPCVFMSSNSHKTRSVQTLLGYPSHTEYAVLPNPSDIDEMLDEAQVLIEGGTALRAVLKERVDRLAKEASQLTERLV